jgi:hypothetical protein
VTKDEPNLPIKINQICQIKLVPAALNMGFWIIWGHEVMHWAIKAGHVTDFQLGGCSGYMYISAILMKRVSYEWPVPTDANFSCYLWQWPNCCLWPNDSIPMHDPISMRRSQRSCNWDTTSSPP